MKKYIIAFGLAVSLLSFLTVSAAAEFPSSGIDEDASTVTIGLENQPTGAGNFTCAAGSLNMAITFTDAGAEDDGNGNLIFKNLSDSSATLPINCFGAAGDYTLDIHLVDKAGNEDNSSESFTILPGTPTDSSLDGDCAGKVANNSDECKFTVVLKDQYGNTVKGQDPKIESPDKTFTNEANTGIGFRAGLRFNNGGGTSFIDLPVSATSIASDNTFKIRAIVPSLVKVGENLVSGFNGLAKVISRDIDFIISNIKEVNPDGSLGNDISNITSTKGLKFANPFASTPTVGTLDLENDVNITIDTTGTLISEVTGTLTSKPIVGDFCEDNTEASCTPDMTDKSFSSLNMNNLSISSNYSLFFKEPDESSNVLDENSVAFVTSLAYQLGGKNVSYPAGGTGGIFAGLTISDPSTIGLNGAAIDAKFIGADIEGFTAVDDAKSFLGKSGSQILNIGLNSAKTDVYEEIVKNGFALARNSANKFTNHNTNTFASLFNGTNNVAVVDLSTENTNAQKILSISGQLPKGKKTLVLINGNLKITGNLTYQNKDDSFGVIVLRTEAGKEPEVGNIFVAPTVSKIAGSYFADGGFMNSDKNNKNSPHTQQLLLEGSLLSRNTLGGSFRGDGSDTDYSPWSDNVTDEVAKRYDLHFVRRYYCDHPANSCTGAVSGETKNNAAFIIRPDQKATILPPPGFKIQ